MDHPSFFGELLPLDARTDEVDDDFVVKIEPSYEVVVTDFPSAMTVSTVLLAVGVHAHEFARLCVVQPHGGRLTARVCLRPILFADDRRYTAEVYLLSTGDAIAVILLRAVPPDEFANELWLSLAACFKSAPSRVLTLSSHAARLYRSTSPVNDDDTAPFVRTLVTDAARSSWSPDFIARLPAQLPPPNSVGGLPAAAVQWCVRQNVPACACLSYFRSTDLVDSRRAAAAFASVVQAIEPTIVIGDVLQRLKQARFPVQQYY